MIGFSGKQYWNDFNNWDEALFQDANRPRDEDKFKIRPWMQSDKRKWRDTNKDTWLPVHQYIGIAVAPTATWTYFTRVSDSWTEQQIKSCCSWYDSIISWWNVQWWTASSLMKDINSRKQAYWQSLAATKSIKVSSSNNQVIVYFSTFSSVVVVILFDTVVFPPFFDVFQGKCASFRCFLQICPGSPTPISSGWHKIL